jgi:predicted esterase
VHIHEKVSRAARLAGSSATLGAVSTISRRRFTLTAGLAAASFALGNACSEAGQTREQREGRLTARPRPGGGPPLPSGPLGLASGGRNGVVQVPDVPPPAAGLPLLVFLHGATQNGAGMLRRVGAVADKLGIAVLAPDSRGTTWDGIRGDLGEDVEFLNLALEFVFARLPIDPARIAIGGFSDGASYALSLGLANGDLFPKVVACSPGFLIQAPAFGRPRLFLSHGLADTILPIDQCSRVIVPRLRSMGYDVTFREFDGRHELPPAIAAEALAWMLRD